MADILNFGSINIDYVYLVEQFVAPGQTLPAYSLSRYAGGKGLNQSIALARAGAAVYHAGKVGRDGEQMVEVLSAAGVETRDVDRSGTVTGHTVIQVNRKGQNCILFYPGANFELDGQQIEAVIGRFARGDSLLLQNEVNSVAHMMRAAHEQGMNIVFNPSPINDALKTYPLELVDCFVLNEIEAAALTGTQDTDAMLIRMAQLYPKADTVLTLGKQGVRCLYGGAMFSHGIYDVPVVDTTAAGDTFTGFFVAEMIRGSSVDEALRRASIASSLAVSRKGASPSIPTMEEVLQSRLTAIDGSG